MYHSTIREKRGPLCHPMLLLTDHCRPRNHHERQLVHYICDSSLHKILSLETCNIYTLAGQMELTLMNHKLKASYFMPYHVLCFIFDCRVAFFPLIHAGIPGWCGWGVCVISSEDSALGYAIWSRLWSHPCWDASRSQSLLLAGNVTQTSRVFLQTSVAWLIIARSFLKLSSCLGSREFAQFF